MVSSVNVVQSTSSVLISLPVIQCLYFPLFFFFCRCEYLLQEKGQEFVLQIQARFPRLFEQVG